MELCTSYKIRSAALRPQCKTTNAAQHLWESLCFCSPLRFQGVFLTNHQLKSPAGCRPVRKETWVTLWLKARDLRPSACGGGQIGSCGGFISAHVSSIGSRLYKKACSSTEQLTTSLQLGFKVSVADVVVPKLRLEPLYAESERKMEGQMAQNHGHTAVDCKGHWK